MKIKFKLIYVYVIVLVIGVSVLIIFTSTDTKPTAPFLNDNSGNQIPPDEIHKNLQNPGSPPPSKDNVSESFKHQMSALQNEVDQNPNDTLKLREYADLLAASHKQDDAIPLYEKILKKYPRRPDILFSLSVIYFNKGDFGKSEEVTKKILLYDKNNPQAQYNLGAIAASKGDFTNAKLIWSELINKNPSSELAGLARESLNKIK